MAFQHAKPVFASEERPSPSTNSGLDLPLVNGVVMKVAMRREQKRTRERGTSPLVSMAIYR